MLVVSRLVRCEVIALLDSFAGIVTEMSFCLGCETAGFVLNLVVKEMGRIVPQLTLGGG